LRVQSNAEFVIEGDKLLDIICFDKKGTIIPTGSFKNGTGELKIPFKKGRFLVAHFLDGLLNDTTFYYQNSKGATSFLLSYCVFKNGFLEISVLYFPNGAVCFKEECEKGKIVHVYYYGFVNPLSSIPIIQWFVAPWKYYDKLSKEVIFNKNGTTSTIIYRPDGSIQSKTP